MNGRTLPADIQRELFKSCALLIRSICFQQIAREDSKKTLPIPLKAEQSTAADEDSPTFQLLDAQPCVLQSIAFPLARR